MPTTAAKPIIIHLSRKLKMIFRPAQRRMSRLLAKLLGIAPILIAGAVWNSAWAQLPTGGAVAAGSASVSTSGNAMTVNQSSNSAILNWQSFSIGAGNSVQFNQPSASATALNRVVGNSASEILGSLSANGRVFLVNQNGILMGSGAQINTGAFVGSTLNIKDADFLSGRYVFDKANNVGGVAGNIINNGSINTPSGYSVLIAPQVTNHGIIAAQVGKTAGTVGIAAGDKVTLDMVGDGLLSIKVDQAALNAAVLNTGTIEANGGSVLISARSANALLDNVLNSSGVIRANSIVNQNGRIILDGGDRGVTSVSGEVTASGAAAGHGSSLRGGTIKVLGDKVGLMAGAKLDASGDAGGGTVLVGGNWQGQGPERNASLTYVDKAASVDVSAKTTGNGGTAVVWADGVTRYAGHVNATGGSHSGNGGNVEVSGKQHLDFQGTADRRATNGKAGTLLLDPSDITISNGANSNITQVVTTLEGIAGQSTSNLNFLTLQNLLATGNVTVDANGAGSATVGTITVANQLTSTSTNTLALRASGGITFTAGADVNIPNGTVALNTSGGAGMIAQDITSPITANTLTLETGSGAALLTSSNSFGTIQTTGGGIGTGGLTLVNARAGGVSVGPITSGGSVAITNSTGALTVGAALNAGTGIVRLQGTTVSGTGAISAFALGVRATTGAINLTGANSVLADIALAADTANQNVDFRNTAVAGQLGQVTAAGGFTTTANGITTSGTATVTLTQNGGKLGQRAANSAITATNLDLKGTGDFELDNASNTITTIAGTGTGAKKFINSAALTVGAVGGTNGFTGGSGDVSLRAVTGDLVLNQSIDAGTGTVRLQADAGKIDQTGGIITAAHLGARAGTSIAFNSTNAIAAGGSFAALAGLGNLGLLNTNGVKIDGIAADALAGVFTLTDGLSAAGNNITLNAGTGTFTQTTGKNITAAGLELTGNAGYTLNNTTNAITTIAAATGTGAISYTNNGALTVGSVGTPGITRTGNVALTSATAGIAINQALNAGTASVSLTAAAGNNVTQTALITASGLALNGGANYNLTNGAGPTGNAVDTIAWDTTGTVSFVGNRAGGLTIGNTGGLTASGTSNSVGIRALNGPLSINHNITMAGGTTLRLQAAGDITQNTGSVIAAVNLGAHAGGTAITLDQATNAISGDVALQAAGANGTITFTTTTGFNTAQITGGLAEFSPATVNGITTIGAGGGTRLTAGGAVTQSQAIVSAALGLGGAGTYTLTNTSNDVTTLAAHSGGVADGAIKFIDTNGVAVGTVNAVDGITRTGNVAIKTQAGDITLTKDINTGVNTNQVTLEAAGKVDQTAGVITTATLGVNALSGDATLGVSTNVIGTAVALKGTGDVKFKNGNSYQINTVAADAHVFTLTDGVSTTGAGKNITLDTLAGTVTQATGKNVTTTATGGLELKGDATYNLTNTTNDVGNIAATTGTGAIRFIDSNTLTVGTVNTVGITRTADVTLNAATSIAVNAALNTGANTNTVRLQSAGAITQAAAGVITTGSLGARGTSIDLSTAPSVVGTTVAMNASAGAAALNNTAGFAVGTVTADAPLFTATTGITAAGDVALVTTTGNIAVNEAVNAGGNTVRIQAPGTITQAAAGVITAGNLGVRGSTVDLSTAANSVSGNVAMNASAGDARYRSAVAFAAGAITAASGFTATNGLTATGNVVLNSAGAVTQSAGNNVTAAGLELLGAGPYTLTNAGNNVATIAGLTTGAVSYTDADALAVGTVNTVGLTTGAANNLTLSTPGILSVNQIASGNNVALTGTAGINLAGNVTSAGTLGLTTTNTAVNQTAGTITATGATTVAAGTGAVTLAQTTNDFSSITATSGALTLRDANALTVTALTVAANSPIDIQATGALTLPAQAINTGTANLTLVSGTTLTTAGTLAGNNVALTGTTGISLGHNVTSAGTLGLTTTNSAVNQTAGTIAATGATTVAAGTGAVTLNQATNDFSTATVTGTPVTIRDANALTVALTTTGAATLTSGAALTSSGTAQSLTATAATGAITNSVATTGNSSLTATTGSATNNGTVGGALTAVGQTGATNNGAVTGAATLTSAAGTATNTGTVGGALTAVGQTGATNNGAVTGAATLTSAAGSASNTGTVGGALTATGQTAVSNTGAVTGNATLASTGGGTVTNAANVNGTLTTSTTGGATTISGNLGALATTQSGAVSFGTTNVAGNAAVTATGAVTQTGPLVVTGTTNITATGQNITLTNAANNFGGLVTAIGAALGLTDSNAMTAAVTATGPATLTAGGNLTSSGTAQSLTATASAGNLTNSVATTGNSTLTATAGSTANTGAVGGALSAAGQTGVTNSANVTGAATLTSAAGAATNSGTAASLTATGQTGVTNTGSIAGNANLTSAGGAVSNSAAITGALVAVGQTAASNTGNVTGNASLSSAGGTVTNAANVNGTLSTSSSGATTLSGTLGGLNTTQAGTLSLGALVVNGNIAATSSGNVIQTAALTQTGAASTVSFTSTGGNVTLFNPANNVQGVVAFAAPTGGVAFANNAAAGTRVGNVTVATTTNSTDPTNLGNFLANDANLRSAVVLRALQGNITRSGTGTIIADRALVVANAGKIGGAPADATLGLRLEGPAGASIRQFYVSAPTSQEASFFGPSTVPLSFFLTNLNGTPLTSPANTYYNGVQVTPQDASVQSAQTSAQIAAQQSANAEAKKAFGTDSVQEQIQFSFTGDVGGTPPFPHSLSGGSAPINIPSCAPGAPRPANPADC